MTGHLRKAVGLSLDQLETPALVVDLDQMKRNIADMAHYCKDKRVMLRPHIKTHKTPEIAKLQMDHGAVGITVAKLSEAETMAEHGMTDILIANIIVGKAKIKRLMSLASRINLAVLTDSEDNIVELAAASELAGITLRVYMEINISDPTGMQGRCGVPFADSQKVIRLASLIADSSRLSFEGILGFRGVPAFFQAEPIVDGHEKSLFAQAGHEEGERLVALAERMREQGIKVNQVIGGSTPTAKRVAEVPGITEVHPGEYVFSGGTHVRTGLTEIKDCALSVITTVISRPHKLRAVIDGGSKTFVGDLHPSVYPNLKLKGHGILSTLNGPHDFPEQLPGAVLSGLNEEHGIIQLEEEMAAALRIGDRIRVIPNHVCPVVNMFDHMYVMQEGKVTDVWKIWARGNNT